MENHIAYMSIDEKNMSVERKFIGWDEPVIEKVVSFLLASLCEGPIDLGNKLIVVPTRQAGRRLREHLAQSCLENNTTLLSPNIVTPAHFLRTDTYSVKAANPTLVQAVWIDVFMQIDLQNYRGLFPSEVLEQDMGWAMHMTDSIQRLRETLVEGGYSLESVYRNFADSLFEKTRWENLAKLENHYLTHLHSAGYEDPCSFKMRQTQTPRISEDIKHIVIAAVPDPTLLLINALERLACDIPVEILVHAPPSMEDHFDTWGRPLTDRWTDFHIEIPCPEENIILAGSPSSQSRNVLEVIASKEERVGPLDIAIGVPDQEVVPFIETYLNEKKLATYDPAGKSMRQHPLYHLLDALRVLYNEETYLAFSTLLKHPDILKWVQRECDISSGELLGELDLFQNYMLPIDWKDIKRWFLYNQENAKQKRFPQLHKAVQLIHEQLMIFEQGESSHAIRAWLQYVYAGQVIQADKPEDNASIQAFSAVQTLLDECTLQHTCGFDPHQLLELFVKRVSEQRIYPVHQGSIIDLEGWLELPWNDAPLLIVTGMNDGFVPESQVQDVFLPDSLRKQLHLRSDADRLARDIYLMQGLIASRGKDGRACFIAGKRNGVGDPLKPSRLFFYCNKNTVPFRVKRLLGEPKQEAAYEPHSISFRLNVNAAPDRAKKVAITSMHVTMFRDYLRCPFRFYLKHILGMKTLDDQKTELDAMDFGLLIHHAFQKMAEEHEMRRCEDPEIVSCFLCSQAEGWVYRRFGNRPPLQVMIQLESAKQRLGAAASVQAELVKEGWRIEAAEKNVEFDLCGVTICGKVDRIDRHRETGCIRILDYKTIDKVFFPEATHVGPLQENQQEYTLITIEDKRGRWIDLQLPVYQLLLASEFGHESVELGYFNLPKSIRDTGLYMWENFNKEQLDHAEKCMKGILRDIQNQTFWPPAEKVPYDDLKTLFHSEISDCIV